MKEKKSFATFLGKLLANAVILAISTCVMSILVSVTYLFVRWILGVVM